MANSRPAQGANSLKPYNRPSAAYQTEISPSVVSTGTSSNPTARKRDALKKSNADVAPKVVGP